MYLGMTTSVQRIGVLGAGQMGSGIAQTAAHFGFEVYLADQNPDFAEKAKAKISASIKKLIEKGKLTQADHDRTINGITVVKGLQDLSKAQLVIEAITENPTI